MTAGQPKKFKSPEELERKINEYFDSCFQEVIEEDGTTIKKLIRPFTITGLALGLDTTRETLLDYKKNYGKRYSYPIKKALQMCENFAEERLFGHGQVAGTIFNMKNNYGWKDTTEVEQTIGFDKDTAAAWATILNVTAQQDPEKLPNG